MKPITEKQKVAIERLARSLQRAVPNLDGLSSQEASRIIDELLAKKRGGTSPAPSYASDALAGLAIKMVTQHHNLLYLLDNEAAFTKQVVALHRIFVSAKKACA